MKALNFEQMEVINGGQSVTTAIGDPQTDDISVSCIVGIASAALFVAGLFAVPVGGYAVGLYVANAILGPTVSGLSVGLGCS